MSTLNLSLVLLLFVLKVLDGVSTYLAVTRYGRREGNPIIAWTFERVGMVPSLILGVVYVTGIAIFLAYGKAPGSTVVLAFCATMLLAVVVKNFRLCYHEKEAEQD